MKHNRLFSGLFLLIGALPFALSGQLRPVEGRQVRLGVSQVNITPEEPVLMSGYDARDTPSRGIHDELFASALYFESDQQGILVITADVIGFNAALADEIRQEIASAIDIPMDHIMLSAVHNHGGPSIRTYSNDLPPSNELYLAGLREKLVRLSAEAAKDPEPFVMGIGKGSCSMNINRRAEFADGGIWLGRNQDGICDHEVGVVKFLDLSGELMAVFINWPCHATASGQDNYRITGDWPGAAARYIRAKAGQGTVVAVTAGASADINPIYGPGDNFNEIEAVGYHVGKEAWEAVQQLPAYPVNSLKSAAASLNLPGKARGSDRFPRETYEPGPDVDVRLQVIQAGNLVLAGISGEVMTGIGMEIKEQSPFSGTFIVTHSNGASGYICTDRAYSEGGYEVQVSRLMPGAEGIIKTRLLTMINAL